MVTKVLADQIKLFVEKSIELHNLDGIVDKVAYEDFEKQISALKPEDFQTLEKFEYFQRYINQSQRMADRTVLKHMFFDGNHLNVYPFLWMCNYFSGAANWLA